MSLNEFAIDFSLGIGQILTFVSIAVIVWIAVLNGEVRTYQGGALMIEMDSRFHPKEKK
ncbi:MAG: hypothetical protein LBR25_08095 [Erysipelotrichaceae bacterium]|jgi:hypothetical protein|nr:hypothetical protein [Erysipelotrichaceae bacterium]